MTMEQIGLGDLGAGLSWVLALIGSFVGVVRAIKEGWYEWEPMRRALRRRSVLLEQAGQLEAAGELEWARRRLYAAEMTLARQLSRFELLREYRVWSLVSFWIRYLLVVGLPATILAGLVIRMDGWMWAARIWIALQAFLLIWLVINLCVAGFWFDGKVRRHARTRLEAAGFRLDF